VKKTANIQTEQQEGRFYARASVDADTIVDTYSEKSFEVVFATETPVFRRSWEENFNEVLSCTVENMRTDRLENGAVPLLNNHYQWEGVNGQLGTVVSWSVVNKECRAKILFSTRDEFAGIWKDIKAKIIRSISAGYNVFKYLREVVSDNSIPNYTAVDWEPLEISLAPVPADYRSKVRNNEANKHNVIIETINKNSRSNMKVNEAEVVETTTTPAAGSETRAATPVQQASPVDEARVRNEAIQAERNRAASIRTRANAAGLETSVADDLISRGLTLDEASAEIFNKMAERSTTPNVRTANAAAVTGEDESIKIRNAMSDALMHRSKPGSVELKDQAHDYKYMSMLDMARSCLSAKGENAGRYAPSEAIKRAISTTDYPILLNSTVERAIRRTYDAMPVEWKSIAQQTTAKDFREKTGIAVEGKVTFEEIAEGGEYKNSYMKTVDSAKIKLKTYGRKITITRQAIINDDLDVFSKLPAEIARGAANFQADAVWGLIINNGKTPDGKTIFHADHSNLAAGALKTAPSEATLSAIRTAMWRQKSPAGELMPLAPKYLIIPAELLTTSEKLLTAIIANVTGDVNIFANKFQIMTSPRLVSSTEWYMAADPQSTEGLVYAYLEGEEGIFVEKEISFDNDSVVTKARLDFAAAAWDYRGWYKNPGA